jgi:threonine/homoserine/homoserine lactone efflux protein
MIDWPSVLAVFSVYVAGVMIPGPNFVAVVHKSVSSSRREALALVAGIVLVNLFWASCAILGVGVVFATFPWLATGARIVGALYLILFGVRLFVRAGSAALERDASAATGMREAFVQGFATNISNPKAMAFFAAVFAAATPPHVSAMTFVAMIACVALIATTWYGLVATVLSHPRVAARYERARVLVDRLCGTLIVLLGIRQLVR